MEKELYQYDIDELFLKFKTNPKTGIGNQEALQRIAKNGKNITIEEKKVGPLQILLRQFKSYIIYILFFAALISLLIGEHIEFFVIGAIIFFIIFLSFIEEYKATKEMDALKKLSSKKARVLRNGQEIEINAEDIVEGDILVLNRGDIVAADARIIVCNDFKVDESALTGESLSVRKSEAKLTGTKQISEQKNMVFSSCHVINGNARCIVVRTGKKTEIGRIAWMIQDVKEESTPLQKRLDKMGRQLSIAVMLICLGIFILGIMRGQPWEEMLLLAVAVSVSGIPESLPAVIAVALALGMKRMAKKKAIIKRLPAVETLGACTVICSDKTGTLTQNKMVIEQIYTADSELNVTGKGFIPEGSFLEHELVVNPLQKKSVAKLIEIGTLCNNAYLKKKDDEWHIIGETTEGALVVLAKKAGIEKEILDCKQQRIHENPFDPERKCMSTVHHGRAQKKVYVKGAPEVLLKKCTSYFVNGKIKKITQKIIEQFEEKTNEYASSGLRVLGFAYKENNGKNHTIKHAESSLIFVGIVSMRDPPVLHAKESVQLCKKAGIKVVMITGDNEKTATAIARELEIYQQGERVVTGSELDKMSSARLQEIVNMITVYARTTPAHKLKIVHALKKAGHIVAMTGDGVNDAPALKQADIGIAMGKRGTEVAKEAAEMIIQDDNFSTIVTAIQEGRTIYENIRRFIYYLFTGNLSEVILILIAVLIGVIPTLTPLMILFINLVTSDIPALGLSLEKPSARIMSQRPRDPHEGVMTEYILLKIAEVIPLFILGTIGIYLWALIVNQTSLKEAQTMAFATIIFFELFHVFNVKSFQESIFSKQIFTNIYLWLSVALSIACTMLVIYWKPLNNIFETVPLAWKDWIPIIITASTCIFYVEIQKSIIHAEITERKRLDIEENMHREL